MSSMWFIITEIQSKELSTVKVTYEIHIPSKKVWPYTYISNLESIIRKELNEQLLLSSNMMAR